MGRLFAASVYVIVAICGLIFGVGMLLLIKAHLSMPVTMSIAGAFALVVVLIQFAVGPKVIDWVVKIRWTTPLEIGPDFDLWMQTTCATFKIPRPQFGIIEEAAPNAFTYGHGAYDARVVVTRGLVEILSPEELKAVVAHELGHIRHRDFIVMTMVQALVLALYALYIASRMNNRSAGVWVMLASYIAYWLSYYASLLLSRIREYMADYASAQIMQNGNDLSRALIKISYGLARTQAVVSGYAPAPVPPASRHAPTAVYATAGATNPYEDQWNSPQKDAPLPTGPDMATVIMQRWNAEEQAKKQKAKSARAPKTKEAFSASNLGAFGIAGASSMRSAIAWFGATDQPDPAHFTTAARWELFNPWARFAELLSTHPLTARRIKALQKLNSIWSVPSEFDFSQIRPAKYKSFFRDLFVLALPLIGAGIGAGLALLMPRSLANDEQILRPFVAAGIGYFVLTALKVLITYPGEFKPNQVLRLLGEVNVSHVKPIPVALEGVFTSRISPGIAWSKDFILQDDTGFVACLYRQPLSAWEFLWGWLGADRYVGKRVRVYGWYRRFGAPYIEIARFETLDTRETVRTYFMPYVLAGSLGVAGLLVWLLVSIH